jgi:hypothetical protein
MYTILYSQHEKERKRALVRESEKERESGCIQVWSESLQSLLLVFLLFLHKSGGGATGDRLQRPLFTRGHIGPTTAACCRVGHPRRLGVNAGHHPSPAGIVFVVFQ